ncbi:MAG: glutathione S-transferase family protein [Pseudomonadota bacterium]
MTTVTIIGAPQSNYVWGTRLALGFKGVAHELQPAAPHSDEVNAIHPLGKIPVMRHGDVTLAESFAICSYVDATFDGPELVPADAAARGRVLQWWSLLITAAEPLLVRQYLFGYLFPGTADGSPNRAQIDAALPDVERYLDILQTGLGEGGFSEDSPSIADAFLLPVLYYTRRCPEGAEAMKARPALSAYLERWLEADTVAATVPPPPAD